MKINRQTSGLTVGELLLVLLVVALAVGATSLFLLNSGSKKIPNAPQPSITRPAP